LHRRGFLLQPEGGAVSLSQAVSLPPPAITIPCYTHQFFVYKWGHSGSLRKVALYIPLAMKILLNCMVHLKNDYYCVEIQIDVKYNPLQFHFIHYKSYKG
jgi:hypothetical protein